MPASHSKLASALALALLFAFPGRSHAADGLVDFSWNACAPVVQDVSSNTPGQFSLYVSVLGIDQAHQAYETAFIYGDASGNVPDAWRFDPERYFLARFLFVETYGVTGPGDPPNTCGGLEKGLCSHVSSASWLDLAGNEHGWTTDPGQAYVSVNGPVVFAGYDARGYVVWTCDPPVPARPVTWG